jgi:hypothetical protein
MKNFENSGNAKVNEISNEVQTSSSKHFKISNMEKKNFPTVTETINGVETPSINTFNIPKMLNLEIDLHGAKESAAMNNLPALEMLHGLAAKDYYFITQPKTSKSGKAYLWIKATKQGEDREEFALYVNDEILKTVVAILFGKPANISGIDANNLDDFNQRIKNFEFELFMAEKAQGRTMKKTHTTTGQTFSSYYKQGVITYKPYLNPELKAYLIA